MIRQPVDAELMTVSISCLGGINSFLAGLLQVAGGQSPFVAKNYIIYHLIWILRAQRHSLVVFVSN
jgi:hypothetical protein